jgi:septal ring factor EnvC (AmiA/AmiB activator)
MIVVAVLAASVGGVLAACVTARQQRARNAAEAQKLTAEAWQKTNEAFQETFGSMGNALHEHNKLFERLRESDAARRELQEELNVRDRALSELAGEQAESRAKIDRLQREVELLRKHDVE